jgi:hypothetical protein
LLVSIPNPGTLGGYLGAENSTIQNLTIRASHEFEAIIVSAIFSTYRMSALTHVTLDLDLEDMMFPPIAGGDWEVVGDGLHDYFPSLTRVDLIFRSCVPEMAAEAKEALCKGLDFLALCQEDGILHPTFLTK